MNEVSAIGAGSATSQATALRYAVIAACSVGENFRFAPVVPWQLLMIEHMMLHGLVASQWPACQLCPISCADSEVRKSATPVKRLSTHEYARFIRPGELAAHCRVAGLELQATKGLQYNPITRRYWLDGDTSVNYMIATRLPE